MFVVAVVRQAARPTAKPLLATAGVRVRTTMAGKIPAPDRRSRTCCQTHVAPDALAPPMHSFLEPESLLGSFSGSIVGLFTIKAYFKKTPAWAGVLIGLLHHVLIVLSPAF